VPGPSKFKKQVCVGAAAAVGGMPLFVAFA
jgi:hypothetical protein